MTCEKSEAMKIKLYKKFFVSISLVSCSNEVGSGSVYILVDYRYLPLVRHVGLESQLTENIGLKS